jgi:hypothetical protein
MKFGGRIQTKSRRELIRRETINFYLTFFIVQQTSIQEPRGTAISKIIQKLNISRKRKQE